MYGRDSLNQKNYNSLNSSQVENDTINLTVNNKGVPVTLNTSKIIIVKEKNSLEILKYIIPILTLLLGIWLNKIFDKRATNKRIKRAGNRWVAELRSLEESLKKQIESLDKFLKNRKKDSFGPTDLSIYASLNGEVFKSLNKDDLLKFIEYRNKDKDFKTVVKISNTVHGYVSVLTFLHETIKIKFQEFLDNTSKYIESLTQNLQSLLIAFSDYSLSIEKELNKDPKDDPRFKPILKLFSDQIIPKMEKGDYNPFELERKFFLPLLKILSDLRMDERTKELSISVSNCFNDIKGMKMENIYIIQNVTKIKGHYKEQLNDLEKIIYEITNDKQNLYTKHNNGS